MLYALQLNNQLTPLFTAAVADLTSAHDAAPFPNSTSTRAPQASFPVDDQRLGGQNVYSAGMLSQYGQSADTVYTALASPRASSSLQGETYIKAILIIADLVTIISKFKFVFLGAAVIGLCIGSLPFDVAVDVDVLLDPIPANDPYTQLKNAVIQRVAKTANRKLRELFTQVELDDQTPSQLMSRMSPLLAGSHTDDDIFRQIWLDKPPVPMQQVLSMPDISISLDKVVNHADRISECYAVSATCANIQLTSTPDRSDRVAISFPEGTPSPERDTSHVELSTCRCSSRRATTPSCLHKRSHCDKELFSKIE
ncbi:hypothetical protein SprV_0200644200 [Sparganum proliferum]